MPKKYPIKFPSLSSLLERKILIGIYSHFFEINSDSSFSIIFSSAILFSKASHNA
jgi:hypothetical protein